MKNPPTLQMCEGYVREKGLLVDPAFFHKFFTEGEWVDSRGNKVKSWKLKMLTWHRMNLERGGSRPCSHSGCKKPGVYIKGADRDGHPLYHCIDHKPVQKPILPKELTNGILKRMEPEPNLNAKRNKALDALERAKK